LRDVRQQGAKHALISGDIVRFRSNIVNARTNHNDTGQPVVRMLEFQCQKIWQFVGTLIAARFLEGSSR
jgi:hypothetical protein